MRSTASISTWPGYFLIDYEARFFESAPRITRDGLSPVLTSLSQASCHRITASLASQIGSGSRIRVPPVERSGFYRRGRRPAHAGHRSSTRFRHRGYLFATSVMLGTILGLPSIALAAITTIDFLQAQLTASGPLIEVYNYQAGSTWAIDEPAEFDLGQFDERTTNDSIGSDGIAFDQLTLKPIGPEGIAVPKTDDLAWWSTDWNIRHCLVIDHTDPAATSVDQYQIRVELDVLQLIADGFLQADTQDFRAVASDGATQLPLWVDPQMDAVWIQIDSIAAGSQQTVCLYYDHLLGDQLSLANHSEEAVFTYATPKPVYYGVHERYSGGIPLEIAGYVDGTQFNLDGGPAATVGAGQLLTVNGVEPGSIISTTGPLSSRALGDGYDSLVPISWAARSFVVPSERSNIQRLSIFAPFGDTTVTIFEGANPGPLTTLTVPANTAVWLEPPGDTINNESILVESDLPILLFHDWTDGRDSFPIAPFLDDEWFGIASTRAHIGANTTGTHIDEYRSDSVDELDRALNRGSHVITDNGGSQGGGPNAGVRLVLDSSADPDPEVSPVGAEFAAISQADSDGWESVTFFPAQELNSRYVIPTSSQYIVVSCPVPGTQIEIAPPTGPATTMTCDGLGTVGWAKETVSIPVTPSTFTIGGPILGVATVVRSLDGAPFYLHYENEASDDETNVLGMKQARQYTWPEPVVADRIEGLFPEEGLWVSPELVVPAGTRIFGNIDFTTVTPVDTELEIQVASDTAPAPTSFAGPDGTSSSFFTPDQLPAVLDFAHDGDQFVRLRVRLTAVDRTKTPRLSAVSVRYNLPLVERDLGVPTSLAAEVAVDPEQTAIYLLRVRTQSADLAGSTLGLQVRSNGPGFGVLRLRLENVATGVASIQHGGVPVNGGPQPFDSASSVSVIADLSVVTPSSQDTLDGFIRVHIQGGDIIAETDFTVEVSSP